MPEQDGTGPGGLGPSTGRGFGSCTAGHGRGFGYRRGWCRFGPAADQAPMKSARGMLLERQLALGREEEAIRCHKEEIKKQLEEMKQDG